MQITTSMGGQKCLPAILGSVLKTPEKYRQEVIKAIAADVKQLREAFEGGFEIIIQGLDARLDWERVSVSEVELYLPISYKVCPAKSGFIFSGEE